MTQKNIILTGFMGTGKTTTGIRLAEKSGRQFIDTDERITELTGRSIADIFAQDGEPAFRKTESAVAKELATQENLVIATGGRLMLEPLNALLLGQNSHVFCLTAETDEIKKRVSEDGVERPLLESADPTGKIQTLLEKRAPAYSQFRQINTTGKSIDQVADKILRLVESIGATGLYQPPLRSRIEVKFPTGRYPVFVGHNLLAESKTMANLKEPYVMVTDSNVGPLHAKSVPISEASRIITIPAGEKHKNLDTLRWVYDRLLASGLDRQGTVLALGGGVVGDLAGFAAATFMRGVQFVQCPTTILAMVDASVGGKTGVDLAQGKNLVGAFKQPLAVLADLDTLKTLPAEEISAGMAEVVKAALIADPWLLQQIENQGLPLLYETSEIYAQMLVVASILVKRDIVEMDPFESGRRKVLNLGHTFGHAIEKVSNFSISHGRCVAIGIIAAIELSVSLGYCSPDLRTRTENILQKLNLPIRIPKSLSPETILGAMSTDKKIAGGRLQFILIRDVGDVFVQESVPDQLVLKALETISDN